MTPKRFKDLVADYKMRWLKWAEEALKLYSQYETKSISQYVGKQTEKWRMSNRLSNRQLEKIVVEAMKGIK